MPKTYSKTIRASGCSIAVGIDPQVELKYQAAKAVQEFAREAGIPFSAELMGKATITDLPRAGDDRRQLVQIEL